MYSLLIRDCAERAVSEACEGAATAAAGSAADTVTVSLILARVNRIETSSCLSADSSKPFRRTMSKPGTATSIVYGPAGRPATAK
jgi:hypothetical protein